MFLTFFRINAQQVFINEIVSSNDSAFADYQSSYPDWIELYNNSGTAVNLNGYFLSDNPLNPFKWQFPDVIINTDDYLIIWASEKDIVFPDNEIHTNFKLSAQGEQLVLSAPDSSLVDFITIPATNSNQSFGRQPDGFTDWFFLSPVTPDSTNNGSLSILLSPVFSDSAGFYSGSFTLFLSSSNSSDTILYTLDGSEPDIDNLGGVDYITKEDYSSTDTIVLSYETFIYTGGIIIYDRTSDTNKLSIIRPSPAWWNPPGANIYKGTVVKAKSWKTGKISSPTVTSSYFIDTATAPSYSVPVISISTSEDNLFDYYKGIHVPGKLYYDNAPAGGYWPKITANYTQKGINWERPAVFEYFSENGKREINQNVGIRIAGNVSRGWGRKSFRVYARKEYDSKNKLEYPFFKGLKKMGNPNQHLDEFKRITVRNSGTYWAEQIFRDAFAQFSFEHIGLDIQKFSPSVVFVNGEYWGVMNVRQRYDNKYLKSHYDVNEEDVVIIDGSSGSVNTGLVADSIQYLSMRNFVKNEDMSIQNNYDSARTLMDVENFAALFMAQIYINNSDWLSNNRKCWRKRTNAYTPGTPYGHDGRYRWFVFDLDHGYKFPDEDRLDIVLNTSGGSTIFKGLLENDGFKKYWINLLADNMNTSFLSARLISVLHDLNNIYDPEIPEHKNRWGSMWNNNSTQEMEDFAFQRPFYMRQFIVSQFAEVIDTALIFLNVFNGVGGNIKINTIVIDENTVGLTGAPYPWYGIYFKGVPVDLLAVPAAGYKFSEWMGTGLTNDSLTVDFSADTLLTAVFVPVDTIKNLCINELLSKNSSVIQDEFGEYDDFIELYNNDTIPVNIAGLFLSDSPENKTKFKISDAVSQIAAGGFALFWADNDSLQGVYHTNFNLDGEGDVLSLYQIVGSDTLLLDSVVIPAMGTDVAFARFPDAAAWDCSENPSPLSSNVYMGEKIVSGLYINEFMASNSSVVSDEFGEYNDWIEIYNSTADTVDLGGLYLTDSIGDPFKYKIPDSTLVNPGGFILFWADNSSWQGDRHLNFKLSSSGEQIGLTQIVCDGLNFIDTLSYSQQQNDISSGRYPDGSSLIEYFDFPTPDASNVIPSFSGIYINEFMIDNINVVADEFGENDDWIELYNSNSQDVDIGGLYITDDLNNLDKYKIPSDIPDSTTIAAGGYLLLWADNNTNQGVLHLNFKLNNISEQIGLSRLSAVDTTIIDSLSYNGLPPNASFGRLPDGGPVWDNMDYTPDASNQSSPVSDISSNQYCTIYPNPTTGIFIVEGDGIKAIRVVDVQGRIIYFTDSVNYSNSINISDLPKGLYIVEVKYDEGVFYGKIILD